MKTLNEASGVFFMGKNLKNEGLESLSLENLSKEKESEEAKKILLEARKQKQKEIDEKVERLEMLPLGNRIILFPYPENPYRKMITESGIITDYKGDFQNPDTGEKDRLPQGIVCGKVIEVGPECKWLKVGDDIYYDSRTTLPIPFYSQGYQTLSELQVLCVLNEGLKERFKMNE